VGETEKQLTNIRQIADNVTITKIIQRKHI